MKPELSLVIPAFNEGDILKSNVEEIARVLEAAHVEYELIVVNNGSTDLTADVIAKLQKSNSNLVPLQLEGNRGKGGGILAGLAISRGDIVGWMDADGQSDPRDIVRLLRLMKESGTPIAKTTRVSRQDRFWRYLQSSVFNRIFRLLFGGNLRDINASPKLFKRGIYERLKLSHTDWFIDGESMIKAIRLSQSVVELDVDWYGRAGGSSKVHLLTSLEFLKNMLLYRMGLK